MRVVSENNTKGEGWQDPPIIGWPFIEKLALAKRRLKVYNILLKNRVRTLAERDPDLSNCL